MGNKEEGARLFSVIPGDRTVSGDGGNLEYSKLHAQHTDQPYTPLSWALPHLSLGPSFQPGPGPAVAPEDGHLWLTPDIAHVPPQLTLLRAVGQSWLVREGTALHPDTNFLEVLSDQQSSSLWHV